MPSSKVRDPQLAVAHPGGQHVPRSAARSPEASMMSSSRGSGMLTAARPSSATASASVAGVEGGEQVAEALAAGDPGGVHERSQPEQLRRSRPARSRAAGWCPAGAGRSRRPGRGSAGWSRCGGPGQSPPVTRPAPGERRGGQQRLVVAGQHRHRPGPRPPRTATMTPPERRVMSVPRTRAQVGADEPGAGA